MTSNKSFKGRVRARMDKTGERYATARRQLVAKAAAKGEPEATEGRVPGDEGQVPAIEGQVPGGEGQSAPGAAVNVPGFRAPYSDEVIRSNTGKAWDEWFALLDAWGVWSGRIPRSPAGSTRSTGFPAGGPRA